MWVEPLNTSKIRIEKSLAMTRRETFSLIAIRSGMTDKSNLDFYSAISTKLSHAHAYG